MKTTKQSTRHKPRKEDGEVARAKLTNRILDLADKKLRAPTAWQRIEIQRQIEELSRQISDDRSNY